MTEPAILAEGLRKSFGDVRALDGADLRAEPGTVLGLLGPNGAGKTTTVREPMATDRVVAVPVRARSGIIVDAVRRLDDAASGSTSSRCAATLDDVFLSLTGHAAEEPAEEEAVA